ncbi:MAG: glycosyltransferase [Phycisphaerales bacterium JB037]
MKITPESCRVRVDDLGIACARSGESLACGRMEATRAFLFAGGGTGGHLFPGLAIAERLGELGPVSSRFVCSTRDIDRSILEAERVEFEPIGASPFGVRPRAAARFLQSWRPAVKAGRASIARLRESAGEVQVVAMGGFVAAPVVAAARAERVPVTLVNLDAAPGKANRWIAGRVDRVVTATPIERPGWEIVGPIVRRQALSRGPSQHCRLRLGLDPDRPTLLITGASQGAASVNGMMLELVLTKRSAFDGWQIIHQTGRDDEERVRAAYARAGVAAEVRAFFREMGEVWGAADLAVTRGGAGSIAEAWANRVPSLVLPYPFHRDRHQRLNAEPLARAGGAILAEDRVDPSRNAAEAGARLVELLGDGAERSAMRQRLAQMGPTDGADRVARILLGV